MATGIGEGKLNSSLLNTALKIDPMSQPTRVERLLNTYIYFLPRISEYTCFHWWKISDKKRYAVFISCWNFILKYWIVSHAQVYFHEKFQFPKRMPVESLPILCREQNNSEKIEFLLYTQKQITCLLVGWLVGLLTIVGIFYTEFQFNNYILDI